MRASAHSWIVVAIAAVAATVAIPPLTYAQVPTDSAARPYRLDGSLLRAGQSVYQTTIERSAAPVSTGWRTVTLSETTYGTTPAWLLLETRVAAGPTSTDSLILARADLRPLHWGSMLGEARVGLEFSGDSVFGAVSAPQGRRSLAVATAPGLIVNQAMLETALRTLALRTDWVDSTLSLSLTMGGAITVPTTLVVSAEEEIRVPAGTYECWVVVASAAEARATYWVAKRERVVVQSVQVLASMADARVVGQLIRTSP
jgi:hypothetical protein